jgi:competence protein ComEC
LLPVAAAIPIAMLASHPDIFIDERGVTAAVRGPDGRLAIVNGRGASFDVENWLRADADPRQPNAPSLDAGTICDALGCIAPLGTHGTLVAIVANAAAFDEDCRRAAIIVSRLRAPAGCDAHALVIDHDRLARSGAHAIYAASDNTADTPVFRVEAAYPANHRPFMPPAPDEPTPDQ